jgi:hypothetical protein
MDPDMQDIFGYLSWESLFQGDNMDTYLGPYNASVGLDILGPLQSQEIDGQGENLAEK